MTTPAIIWLVLPISDGLHRGPAAGLETTLALIVAIATVLAGLFGAMAAELLSLASWWAPTALHCSWIGSSPRSASSMGLAVTAAVCWTGEAAPGQAPSCWCLARAPWRRELALVCQDLISLYGGPRSGGSGLLRSDRRPQTARASGSACVICWWATRDAAVPESEPPGVPQQRLLPAESIWPVASSTRVALILVAAADQGRAVLCQVLVAAAHPCRSRQRGPPPALRVVVDPPAPCPPRRATNPVETIAPLCWRESTGQCLASGWPCPESTDAKRIVGLAHALTDGAWRCWCPLWTGFLRPQHGLAKAKPLLLRSPFSQAAA